MDTKLIWIITMHKNNELLICRVCGLKQNEPQWGDDGETPTYNICDCCGVEFGYEDSSLIGIKNYRNKWLSSGGRWTKPNCKPENWTLENQLPNIPVKYL